MSTGHSHSRINRPSYIPPVIRAMTVPSESRSLCTTHHGETSCHLSPSMPHPAQLQVILAPGEAYVATRIPLSVLFYSDPVS